MTAEEHWYQVAHAVAEARRPVTARDVAAHTGLSYRDATIYLAGAMRSGIVRRQGNGGRGGYHWLATSLSGGGPEPADSAK